MANTQHDDLRSYAVMGAEQRLLQIANEAANIFRVFPELRGRGFMTPSVPSRARAAKSRTRRVMDADGQKPKKRRRKMSAAARKRIGDAQRARWANQRAANGMATKKR